MTERDYYLAFSVFKEGIGPYRLKLLVDLFGSAEKAWKADQKRLVEAGLPGPVVEKFINFRRLFNLKNYLLSLEKLAVQYLTIIDNNYPALLGEIPDPPPVLYILGNPKILETKCIGVVGTRKITSYGREVTEYLTKELVSQNLTIVSGMARGVDSVAHKTALDQKGQTVAVLGSGVDIVYPPENFELHRQIAKSGAVVSEMPLGHWASRGVFPARNRIISGLSLGIVVTEGDKDSGSLITAREAAKQGREVFAVPGPITNPYSKGPSILIKEGAKLVGEVGDILDELNLAKSAASPSSPPPKSDDPKEQIILDLLISNPLSFDELVRNSNLSPNEIGSILSILEIRGCVKNIGNTTYSLK